MKKILPFACALFAALALDAATKQAALDAAPIPGADYFGHGAQQRDAPVIKKIE